MDIAKMTDVNLLDLLCATKFCLRSKRMLFCSQNKKRYVRKTSMTYLTFTASKVIPSIIPRRRPRKISRIKEAFSASKAYGKQM